MIGGALRSHYLQNGDRVIGIDDLSTGVYDYFSHESYTFILHHIQTYSEAFILNKLPLIDVIIHCAAVVGVKNVVENPTFTIENNIDSTKCMLSIAHQLNVPIFIFSTSEVYGKSSKPLLETDDVTYGPSTKARWSYATSKYIDEILTLDLWKKKNIPTTIIRLFNVSGPTQLSKYGMVLPRFVEQALRNEPITIFGTGSQMRCFTHISDVVKIITRLVEAPKHLTQGQIFNVGNPESIDIVSVANFIIEETLSKSKRVFGSEEKFYNLEDFEDMPVRKPDVTRLLNVLEQTTSTWKHWVSWKELVKDIIKAKTRELSSL